MNIKRKILTIIISGLLIFTLTGCSHIVETTQEDVIVTIINSDYDSAWMQPVKIGKNTTYINHSAKYEIYVEYKGESYIVDDETIYEKFKDKIGETVIGTLKTNTYDNGRSYYYIIDLK